MTGGGQMLKEISLDEKENFTPEQIQRFKDDVDFYTRFVKGIEKDTSGNFRVVWSDYYLSQALDSADHLTLHLGCQGRAFTRNGQCQNQGVHDNAVGRR